MALKANEIEKLREKYGYNEIKRKKAKTKFEVLVDVINDPILIIMAAAAVLSFITNFQEKHFAETYVIILLIVVNVLISFIQDLRTIEKLKALDEMNEDKALVIRDDKEIEIPSRELLPGDLVKLNIGIIARADMKIIESNDIQVDESFLTGESEEVSKEIDDMIYSNSAIKNGVGLAEVTAIAMNTRIGQITSDVDEVEEIHSQLEVKIHNLTKFLLKLSIVVALIVFALALINGYDLLAGLSLTISILIATVPEGLATVLTIVLTTMSTRMAKNNALIKKVDLLETLGEVTYVCSDKTGTITLNQMTVTENKIFNENLANEIVKFCINSDTPTSRAIKEHVDKFETKKEFELLDAIPFSSKLKKEVNLITDGIDNYLVVFGAPDFLVTNIDEKVEEYNEYANKGLRTLLFSFIKTSMTTLENLEDKDLINLNLLSLYGIQDPPKESAVKAIKEMHDASIKVVMITGDSLSTAKSIAKQAGIIEHDDEYAITGAQLNEMSDEEFLNEVEHIRVYARTQPEDKVRIVKTLQKKNEIVSMTGDGTNDSIALKQANIGVAMAINGTDISKESADLLLLDDNFATISVAIKSGRQIFDNLQKFVRQMLTSNAAHTGSILFALLFGMIFSKSEILLPMTPILILWVNIISDAIPCLALGLEEPESDIMTRKPIDKDAPILKKNMIVEILIRGLSIGLIVYFIFNKFIDAGTSVEYARSLGFVALSFGQLIHIFDARSFKTIYLKNPLKNKPLILAVLFSAALNLMLIYTPINETFGLEPVSLENLLYAIFVSSLVTFGYSLIKLIIMKYKEKKAV